MTGKTEQNTIKAPDSAISTKIKFTKSEETGAVIGFISQNPVTKRISGVRQDCGYPKKICVLDKAIAPDILLNVLYDAVMIPMKEKDGYVVISATPVQFKATIETVYVPKAIYQVLVRFGNKTVVFDPKDGIQDTRKNLVKCRQLLEKRVDIKDISTVVDDFLVHAHHLLKRYEKDGFYYKAG